MKQRKLIPHLREHGCEFIREGRKHTVYYNPSNKKTSTMPRHSEIMDALQERFANIWKSPFQNDHIILKLQA
jgi:predicted RNA binding protein YcfA (HicA-like mRNA interferase family)